MSVTRDSSAEKQVLEQLEEGNIVIPAHNSDGNPTVDCDTQDCNYTIRPGNPIVLILTKSRNSDWEVKFTLSDRCKSFRRWDSIPPDVEKVPVIGTLISTTSDENGPPQLQLANPSIIPPVDTNRA